MIGYRGPRAGSDWTLRQWLTYRNIVAEYLDGDPKWHTGKLVLRMCDANIARLSNPDRERARVPGSTVTN